MMGIFTSAGSLARALGPITVGFLYKHWGPRVLMIFMLIVVLTGVITLLFNFRRLVLEPELPDDISDDDDEEKKINNGDNDNFEEERMDNSDDQRESPAAVN
jgi:MFS family permease